LISLPYKNLYRRVKHEAAGFFRIRACVRANQISFFSTTPIPVLVLKNLDPDSSLIAMLLKPENPVPHSDPFPFRNWNQH
jgi:hypothetical protein